MAVVMKFDVVLMMLTRTVEKARVRARVKRPHMMASKSRFSRKKKPRKANSKTLLSGERLNKEMSACDQLVVSDVVVLFATRESISGSAIVLLAESRGSAQLGEHAVEGGTSTASNGQGEPCAARLGSSGRHCRVGLSCGEREIRGRGRRVGGGLRSKIFRPPALANG